MNRAGSKDGLGYRNRTVICRMDRVYSARNQMQAWERGVTSSEHPERGDSKGGGGGGEKSEGGERGKGV